MNSLIAASCFSGIGAPELGGPEYQWLWHAEVNSFASAVFHQRFPHSVNLGDVTDSGFVQYASAYGPLDLLVGGPPCQDFSVAGLRAGIAGDRGNLSLRFLEIAHAIRPRNLLVENVPGWLNMPDNAFGCFLAGLVGADDPLRSPLDGKWPSAGMVAGPRARAAWRVFDAQYFGVTQRRRRVFVVADFGDGADPAEVLFERKGVRGNTPPRREKGENLAPTISARAKGGGGLGTDFDCDGGLIAGTVSAKWAKGTGGPSGDECQNLVVFDCKGTEVQHSSDGVAPPLRAMGHKDSHQNAGGHQAIAWSIMPQNSGKDYKARTVDVAQPVMAGGPVGGNQGGDYIQQGYQVRRLTPTECERLQGFPDGFTSAIYRNKPASDGPRYKALGNSWAVPCGRWIISRIAALQQHERKVA